MKKTILGLVIIIVLLIIAGLLWRLAPKAPPANGRPAPSINKTAQAEKAGRLPQVITLFQKGEGESDLAVYVSNELASKYGNLARFRAISVEDDSQTAALYGISSVPAVIILSPAGKVVRVHEGYLDQEDILRTLKAM